MNEKESYEKQYNAGYQNGREWYVNDISKEIHDVKCAIRIVDRYIDNFEISNELEGVRITLEKLQTKVKEEFDKVPK